MARRAILVLLLLFPVLFPATFSLPAAAPLQEAVFLFASSTAAQPTISSISPSSAGAGGPGLTLAVNGTNFLSGSIVRWNNLPRSTTFVSETRLTASILASDVAAPGTAVVTVVQPDGTASSPVTFTITTETVLHFAQIAEGKNAAGTNKTVLIVINPNDKQVAAFVEFFISPSGDPFPIDIEIGGIGLGTFFAFEATIPAKSQFTVTSAGTRPTASPGWARVKCQDPIGGLAIFQLFNAAGGFVTEAGVGASPLAKRFVIPAEFKDEFENGVALVNPFESSTAVVTLTLRSQTGLLVGTVSRQLGPKQHAALFLRELFPGMVNPGFLGSIEVESTELIASTTLRTRRGLQTSTLPIVAVP